MARPATAVTARGFGRPDWGFDVSQRTCGVGECTAPHLARGMCQQHYNRWHYSGSPDLVERSETCRGCGDPTVNPPSGPRPKWCSRSCRSKATYVRHAERYRAGRRAKSASLRVERPCTCCGLAFTPELTISQIYCSKACSKRVQNASRRAKSRGIDAENLHWRGILLEDGPACHICGIDTDPDDIEWVDGSHRLGLAYPTIDHVVALANGGAHARANVRLAHLYCNSVKSDRDIAA